jgi:sterol desaturase/sphingolipid hydroxylase (fatty acid hydroxylase superfamily)
MIIPLPESFTIVAGLFVALWTMYIHTGTAYRLPWPLMGSDYHLIHHVYNWYNIGLYTHFWDWVFGTLKHPRTEEVHKALPLRCSFFSFVDKGV